MIARLVFRYVRITAPEKVYTVSFDIDGPTQIPDGTTMNLIVNGLRQLLSTQQVILSCKVHKVKLVRRTYYDKKTGVQKAKWGVETGEPVGEFSLNVSGAYVTSGDSTAAGVGCFFTSSDTTGKKAGRFIIKGGIYEAGLGSTTSNNWPVPASLSNALLTITTNGGAWTSMFSGGGNAYKFINQHILPGGGVVVGYINGIIARRVKQYMGVKTQIT